MKILKNIIEFLVDTSFWVALAVLCLVKTTCFLLSLDNSFFLEVFIFSSVVFSYNLIKKISLYITYPSFSLSRLKKYFLELNKKRKLVFFVNFLFFLVSISSFYYLQKSTKLIMSVPLLLTLFYSVSFGNKTLRNVEGLKIYVVGLTWAIVTVLLPIIESESTFKHEMLIVFSQRFLFTIILILPFEIRDLSEDDKRLRTIPQKIGVQKTKYYGYLLLLFFCVLDYFRLKGLSSSVIILCTVIFFSIAFAKERQSRYYSSFFVEGIPVLWYLLLLIF